MAREPLGDLLIVIELSDSLAVSWQNRPGTTA